MGGGGLGGCIYNVADLEYKYHCSTILENITSLLPSVLL